MRRLFSRSVNDRSANDDRISAPLNQGEYYNNNSSNESSDIEQQDLDFHSGGSQLLSNNSTSRRRLPRNKRGKRQMRVADKAALSLRTKRNNHLISLSGAQSRPIITARQNQVCPSDIL
ncbi:unnamed protein product [Dracunculus medinensis]|uniref:Uncharacterized protein n=1 Tax=Dracunculus medinensis TaxID=318479 RepID=A0A0N4UQK6_DRAME|nr:unnamed protein product [Dracunculus medinensis]